VDDDRVEFLSEKIMDEIEGEKDGRRFEKV
jgi:hypothetical protein